MKKGNSEIIRKRQKLSLVLLVSLLIIVCSSLALLERCPDDENLESGDEKTEEEDGQTGEELEQEESEDIVVTKDTFDLDGTTVEVEYDISMSAAGPYDVFLKVYNNEKSLSDSTEYYTEAANTLSFSPDLRYIAIIDSEPRIISVTDLSEKLISFPQNFKLEDYYHVLNSGTVQYSFEDFGIESTEKTSACASWYNNKLLLLYTPCRYTGMCKDSLEDESMINHFEHNEGDPKDVLFIYDPNTASLKRVDIDTSIDLRYGGTTSDLELYGSLGLLDNDVLFYTTFYYEGASIDNPSPDKSSYGVEFVNVDNPEQKREFILKEYTYEDLPTLDHYITKVEVKVDSFDFSKDHGDFLYRFTEPINEGSDRKVSDWMTYEY